MPSLRPYLPIPAWLVGLSAPLVLLCVSGVPASRGLMAVLLWSPCAVALVIPATAGRLHRGMSRVDLRRELVAVLAPAFATFVLACFSRAGFGGALALGTMAGAFAALGAGIRAAFGGGRANEGLGPQIVATLVLLLLVGGIFGADPVIERYRADTGAREGLISFTVGWNPLLVMAGRILEYDLMHAEILYTRLSVIARYYRFEYPAWGGVAAGYLLAGAALAAAGVFVRRRPAGA